MKLTESEQKVLDCGGPSVRRMDMTMTNRQWRPIEREEIPINIRWDTPRRNQGQIIEASYGTFGRGEADEGDLYRRTIDHSLGPHAVSYSKRACCRETYCCGHERKADVRA